MLLGFLGDRPQIGQWLAQLLPAPVELKSFGTFESTTQALLPLVKDVLATSPEALVVCFGTTDLFKKVALTTFEMNLKLLAKALTPIASRVVLTTLLDYSRAPIAPAISSFFGMPLPAFVRRTEEMNDRLRLVARRSGFKLADLAAQTKDLAALKEWFASDGMQLSAEGGRELAARVLPVVTAK
jgi:lysophospholipase L1-like esterase